MSNSFISMNSIPTSLWDYLMGNVEPVNFTSDNGNIDFQKYSEFEANFVSGNPSGGEIHPVGFENDNESVD